MTKKTILLTAAAALFMGTGHLSAQDAVLEQAFGEHGETDAGKEWENVSQRGQAVIKPLKDGKPALRINNHVIGRSLPKPLTERFVLEVEALHSEDGAMLWFGLFDDMLEKGYIVSWSNPPASQGYFNGKVALRKVTTQNGDKPEILLMDRDRNRQSEVLGSEVPPPHSTMEEPLPTIKLTWDKPTHELTVYFDGVEVARATDDEFNQFDALLLSGNKFSIYRSVTLKGQ